MNEIFRFLSKVAATREFSDAHVEQSRPVRLRTPAGWVDAGFGVVTEEHLSSFLQAIDNYWRQKLKNGATLNVSLDLAESHVGQEYRGRFRCCVYNIDGGRRIAASLRRIHAAPIPLERVGAPAIVASFASVPRGMFLVTGPTGSGKTTTIMSLLARILEKRAAHIVTIEDPVEYVLPAGLGIVSQREVGIDTPNFAAGLRDALRQRPDVIMVGEIRDHETADTAMRAAESGHFVVATLHARSAVGALQKMQSLVGDEDGLGGSIVGVLAQSLVPSANGDKFVLAAEMIPLNDPDLQSRVSQRKWQSVDEALRRGERGCVALNTTLANLVRRGDIAKEHALMATYDIQGLARAISGQPE